MPSSHTPKEAGRARNASFICTPKLASTCPGINFLTALSDGEEGSCPGDEVFQPEHPSIVLSPPIVLEAALWPLMWGQEGPPPRLTCQAQARGAGRAPGERQPPSLSAKGLWKTCRWIRMKRARSRAGSLCKAAVGGGGRRGGGGADLSGVKGQKQFCLSHSVPERSWEVAGFDAVQMWRRLFPKCWAGRTFAPPPKKKALGCNSQQLLW